MSAEGSNQAASPSQAVSSSRAGFPWIAIPALLLAAWGLYSAVNLGRAAWILAGTGEDPVVTRIGGTTEFEAGMKRAAALSRRDLRYPLRLAERMREDGAGERSEEIFFLHDLYLEAARRAPSFAEARFWLSWSAYYTGDPEEADAQAKAALRLSPLHPDLRQRISVYFQQRFRRTRSREHLRAAVRAMGASVDRVGRGFLGDPLLTYEEIEGAFAAAEAEPADAVMQLCLAGRWEWAVRMAEEKGAASAERDARTGYASYLLDLGLHGLAAAEIERARSLPGFGGWLVLARTRFATGERETALTALQSALDDGASIEDIESALGAKGTLPEDGVAFWSVRTEREEARRLALARAHLRAGDSPAALAIARDLRQSTESGAEANHLLATLFLEKDSRSMALRHAREALRLDPGNTVYKKLVKRIEGGRR